MERHADIVVVVLRQCHCVPTIELCANNKLNYGQEMLSSLFRLVYFNFEFQQSCVWPSSGCSVYLSLCLLGQQLTTTDAHTG